MSWLTINGIETSGIASIGGAPAGTHRDIGAQHEAADGSLSLTRQVRKRDLKLETVPLSGSDAYAWESLLVGEGQAWSFNASLYGSKGTGPSTSTGASSSATFPKFGAASCRLTATTGTVSYVALPIDGADWTVAVWRSTNGTTWNHYVVTSEGQKWVDGVRNDAASTTWLTVTTSTGTVKLDAAGTTTDIDDLVVCPYVWLDDWAAQVYAAGVAFGATPILTAAGLLVPEADTRSMVCVKCDERIMKANLSDGNGLAPDVRVLSVELKGR